MQADSIRKYKCATFPSESFHSCCTEDNSYTFCNTIIWGLIKNGAATSHQQVPGLVGKTARNSVSKGDDGRTQAYRFRLKAHYIGH